MSFETCVSLHNERSPGKTADASKDHGADLTNLLSTYGLLTIVSLCSRLWYTNVNSRGVQMRSSCLISAGQGGRVWRSNVIRMRQGGQASMAGCGMEYIDCASTGFYFHETIRVEDCFARLERTLVHGDDFPQSWHLLLASHVAIPPEP